MAEATNTLNPPALKAKIGRPRGRTMVTKVCAECGKEFQAEASQVKAGRSKLCSRQCGGKAMARKALVTTSVETRFWKYTDRRGDDECWPWLGFKYRGYGRMTVGKGKSIKTTLQAHRVSWELVNGPIPKGMIACHRCDNPSCVNPAHLFLGSIADNNADRDTKGRQAKGERIGKSILTEEQVERLISSMPASYREMVLAANWLGVSVGAIGSIVRGDNWRHLCRSSPQG